LKNLPFIGFTKVKYIIKIKENKVTTNNYPTTLCFKYTITNAKRSLLVIKSVENIMLLLLLVLMFKYKDSNLGLKSVFWSLENWLYKNKQTAIGIPQINKVMNRVIVPLRGSLSNYSIII
jgi:hypothetical protein